MIFEIVFTKKANETFDAIRSQILSKWGESSVIKFEQRTLKVLEMIAKYPLVYQSIDDLQNIRKAHVHKNCSFFYNVNERRIVIAFFWDNRQDPVFL